MSALPGSDVKPTILVVDDEPVSLATVTEELRTRYGRDYRVLSESSARAALDRLNALAGARDEVAMILAAQWLPDMSGVELLAAASPSSGGDSMGDGSRWSGW